MTERRLLARFILRGMADDVYRCQLPIAAGDYLAEASRQGEDVEILLFANDEAQMRGLRYAMLEDAE